MVHRELSIPDHHIVLSGMALGHPDPEAEVNTLRSERIPPAEFVQWHR